MPLASDQGGADLSRSAIARYIQLATLFRRRIESGQWRVGGQIPIVDDLSAECGVARATIRKALGLLEAEGLVERFRAKGTFVRRRPQGQVWHQLETQWSELLSARDEITISLLSETRDTALPFRPHPIGETCESYRQLGRIHARAGVPILLEEVYLSERLLKGDTSPQLLLRPALRLVTSAIDEPLLDVRQTYTLGAADIETAGHLQLPLNAPVMHVSRSAVDSRGDLVLVNTGIYRGDVVKLDFKFC